MNGGTLNAIAGQTPIQTESIVISGPLSVSYGTGTLTATFSNGSLTGTGLVTTNYPDTNGATNNCRHYRVRLALYRDLGVNIAGMENTDRVRQIAQQSIDELFSLMKPPSSSSR